MTTTRQLGTRTVSAVGLGAMPLSIEGRPDREQALATIHAALDAGITLIDTADAYHRDAGEVGHNEELIAQALASYGSGTDDVVVATKGGHLRPGDGSWTVDGRPEHLREAVQGSLRRLGVEAIDLYQLHRPDPAVPYEESLGALAEMVQAGTIRAAGISNADTLQIHTAHGILGEALVSVQNRFSPSFRSSRDELRLCAELGLTFLAYSPLGGIGKGATLGQDHAAFAEVARARGVSAQQVTLAWELAQSPTVLPIPGSSRPTSTTDSAAASTLELTDREVAALDAA